MPLNQQLREPQVTKAQVELWLDNPVTKTLVKCLQWQANDIRDEIGNGSFLDQANADLTLSRLSKLLGMADGFDAASKVEFMLNHYAMIEVSDV